MASPAFSPPSDLTRAWRPAAVALTLGVAAFLAWTLVSAGQVGPVLAAAGALGARPELVGLFFVTYTLAFALRALAWRVLLPHSPPARRLFTFLQIALLANHLFPTKVGELLRVALLSRAATPLSTAATSTAVARLLDLASLALIVVALSPLTGHGTIALAAALAPTLLLVIAGVALLRATGAGLLQPLWPRLPPPIGRIAREVESAVRTVRPRQIALAAALTLPSWLLEATALWSIAQAAGVPLSPALAGVATAFTIAFQGFQFTPGGLGLYEASLTGVLVLHGIDPGVALTLAVATHALKFAYAYLVGGICLATEALRDAPAFATPPRYVRALRPWLDRASAVALALAGCFVFLLDGSPLVAILLAPLLAVVGAALARQWWAGHHPLNSPAAVPAGSRLTVVIPVRDEAATIAAVVARVPRERLAARGVETTVLVVDDGSRDASGAVARAAGADCVVRHPDSLGLGAAVRSGLSRARRDGATAAVYLDGDGEYDPAEVAAVAEPVLAGQADYVLGTRFPGASGVMRPSRLHGNRGFTLLLTLLSGRRISDGQTGFRAFGPRALDAFEIIHDYNYAQVLTLDLLRKGMRLSEVPIGYRPRRAGRSFIRYPEYARRVLPAIARELLAP